MSPGRQQGPPERGIIESRWNVDSLQGTQDVATGLREDIHYADPHRNSRSPLSSNCHINDSRYLDI